jgi:NAD(P)-dependent dehydrogenase (short-subunit alcohol dehydrogenase family)
LITGGGAGIGAAISRRLMSDGVSVFAVHESTGKATAAAKAFAEFGHRFRVAAIDLCTDEGCQEAIAQCLSAFARVDILVNCAAITGPAALSNILEENDESFSRLIDVNFKAPYRMSRYAARSMAGAGGVIVNVGSTATFAAQAQAAAYTASKAGLLGMTKGLALDLAEHKIRVVMVAPGAIETEASSPEAYLKNRADTPFNRVIPLGRRGTAREVAEAVAYLCSEHAGFITGTCLTLDGGVLAY